MKILQKEKKNAMFAIYAFCKKTDSIADSFELKSIKKKKIKELRIEIEEIYNNKLNNNFRKTLKYYIDKYKLNKKYFLDIIKGVEMDINDIMICPSKKIFNLYCYRVAGAVGLISLKIFGYYNKKSKSFGLYLANALQITNILRDIKEDKSMGRMYIPRDILYKNGIKTAQAECDGAVGPVANLCVAALDRAHLGAEASEKALDQSGAIEMASLEKNMTWISLSIAIAPMFGFLGTVWGMIEAFNDIKAANDISVAYISSNPSTCVCNAANDTSVT